MEVVGSGESKGQKDDVRGRVFYIQQTDDSYIVKIIFKYSYENLKGIREGVYVSAKSFESFLGMNSEQNSGKNMQIQSILIITNVLPVHPSIESLKSFERAIPTIGYLENISDDFDVVNPPQNLFILADAISTGYSFYMENGKPVFIKSDLKPVMASPVEILDKNIIESFINPEIGGGVIKVGKIYIPSLYTDQRSYVKDNSVPDLKLRVDKLISMHYGIYGTTGSGKSNLSAHIISEIARLGKIEGSEIKIIIFDHSNEYLPLLADLSDNITYISAEDKEQVIEHLKFPLTIEDKKSLVEALKNQIYERVDFTEEKFVEDIPDELKKLCKKAIYGGSDEEDELDRGSFIGKGAFYGRSNKKKELEIIVEKAKKIVLSYAEKYYSNLTNETKEDIEQKVEDEIREQRSTRSGKKQRLDKLEEAMLEALNIPFIKWLVSWANNEKSASNYRGIVIVYHDYLLRNFVASFISKLLEERKKGKGKNTYVLIVIDEAHEYAPQQSGSFANAEASDSSIQIEKLARMGRKYRVGLCLSSQRLAYLNTSVRANIRTVFVGPLLQEGDKKAIFEAANISPEHLHEIRSVQSGHWLVSSGSGALGQINVPVKVVAYNREDRIQNFVENLGNSDRKKGNSDMKRGNSDRKKSFSKVVKGFMGIFERKGAKNKKHKRGRR